MKALRGSAKKTACAVASIVVLTCGLASLAFFRSSTRSTSAVADAIVQRREVGKGRTGSNHPPKCNVAQIPTFKSRLDIASILQEERFQRGAELGVQKGEFARHNLQTWTNCTEYVLVDAWKKQENYMDIANKEQAVQDQLYRLTMKTLRDFSNQLTLCRDFTTECVKRFEDGHFHFIYVDARHDYMGAKQDIESWWPKLAEGGIMAGHDYIDALEVGEMGQQNWSVNSDGSIDKLGRAVKGAVDEFAAKINVQVVLSYRDGPWNSWVLRKPECTP